MSGLRFFAVLLPACAAGQDSASGLLAETPTPLATRRLLVPGPAGAIASIRVDSTGVVWILDNTGEVMRYERAQGHCLLHGTLATIGDGLAPVTDLEVDSFRHVYADLGYTELHGFSSDGVDFGVCEHRAASAIAPDPRGGTVYTWDAGGTHISRLDIADPDCPTDGVQLDVDADAVGIANGEELVLAAVDGFDMAPPAHRFDRSRPRESSDRVREVDFDPDWPRRRRSRLKPVTEASGRGGATSDEQTTGELSRGLL